MRIKSFLLSVCIVFIFACLPSILRAQPGPGGPDPDPQVPIDGGVSLLVAAGVGYAIKKAHDKKKTEKLQMEKEK